jgi:ABC-type nitrate/sulfonate/bicarbonate transport system substrate-binding protein
LELRLGVWWDDVTNRGRQTSEVLAAFQRQHRLPELYTKIVENLSDASRYIAAREAAASEAERKAKEERQQADEAARQEDEARRQELDRAIALISFILLPASGYSAARPFGPIPATSSLPSAWDLVHSLSV